MYLVHYYLQKGFKLDYLINLTVTEKMFFRASMEIANEEEMEKYKTLFRGGK